ncbi:MAG TPA: AsmA family protein [Casimicrobiaceae bacterium]|nr:AsmA family protein [Casimicrobiaceae bacterium]
MPRAVWIILGAVGGLVALLLIGVAIAVATVDPGRFVAPLAARVKAETGRDLTVQGPVDITLSLEPKIVLPGVAFGNAPWSKTREMLTAKRIEAQIALIPLLSRRFEVVEFTLVEPVITLETDASGRGNWEFENANPTSTAAPGGGAAGAAAIGIGNLEIRNGTLNYRNGATGKVTIASIERMTLRARDMQAPVAVDFRGKVDEIPVALAGDVGAPDKWLHQQWPVPIALKGDIDGNAVKLDTKIARAGTTTSLDELNAAFGAIGAKGSIKVINDGSRTRYAVDLTIPSLSLKDLPAKAEVKTDKSANSPPAQGATPAPAAAGAWVIPDTPLPIAPFVALNTEGSIAVGEVVLRDGTRVSQVGTHFTSRDASLDAKFTAGTILGGSMHGEVQFDGRNAQAPGVHLLLDAQDLDLAALAAVAGIKREIHGGRVRAGIDIRGQGATPHRIAGTMSGTISVVSGPATLGRSAVQGESALAQIAGALDPLHGVDTATDLRCAVFRLPLSNGVAHVDHSIAIETGKIAASASGTLNFRDETLDLTVQPQIREGVKIDLSQFASLVRIRGRFDKPAVAIDAAQSAKTIAEMAALGATGGGLAVIGKALISSTSGTSAPCEVAMTGKAPRESAPLSSSRKAPPRPDLPLPKDLGKALGDLLRR